MRKFKLFRSLKFNLTIGLALASTAVALEVVIPAIKLQAANKAQTLARQAQKESITHPNQAIIDYRVSLVLSPSNHQIVQKLSELYLRQNRPDDAISVLQKLPKDEGGLSIALVQMQTGRLSQAAKTLDGLDGSDARVLIAKSRVLLEQGKTGEALASAIRAQAFDATNGDTQVQLGLCYAIQGRNSELNALISSVTDQNALQALKEAQLGKTALAYELYSRGLLRSSRKILINEPSLNANQQLLLGRISLILSSNDKSKLSEAQNWLVQATQNDPANAEAHRLLQTVFLKIGDHEKADRQGQLVEQLESGKV